jgi:autotransporter-associated beta strand protein
MNAGSSQITQAGNGSQNIAIGTSLVRNVGSTLVVSRGSSGSAGFFKASAAGIIPWDTGNSTVPGYLFIRSSNVNLGSGGKGGGIEFATTASGTGTFGIASYNNVESTWTTLNTIAFATNALSLTASRDIRALKVAANTASTALDLAGNDLTVEGGGLIYAPYNSGNQSYEIKNTGGTGALHGGYDATAFPPGTAAGNTDSTAMVQDLIVYTTGQTTTPTASLTISATIADNTTGVGHAGTAMPTALTKAGPGILILSGTNTYTGNNYFNDGIVQISSNANLGDPGTGASINFGSANGTAGPFGTTPVTLLATSTLTLDNGGANKRNITIADKGAWMAASGGNALTISGVISTLAGASNAPVTFGVATSGTGTMNLTGNNNYTGTTTVAAGKLLVNGTNSGGGAYTVNSGATLGGSGTIQTANNAGVSVLTGGSLSPGNSPGVLSMDLGSGVLDISGAASGSTASMLFDLDLPGTSDEVVLTNAASSLKIGSGLLDQGDFNFTTTGNLAIGQEFVLFDSSNPINGTLGPNLLGGLGGFGTVLGLADNGHDIVLDIVPEPASLVLMCLGAGAMGFVGIRRRRSA